MLHIEISYSGLERSPALDDHVRDQLDKDHGRHANRLTRIEAHLSDENSHKKGVDDRRCVLEARPRAMDPIVVTHEGDDIYKVIREASKKLGRALSRRFERDDANA